MARAITSQLRELIDDPEMGISNRFLRELLAYILRLEAALYDRDDGK